MIHKLILVTVSAFVDRCKKRQCNSKYDCKLGDHCVGGFCKPQPGFCSSDGDCDKNQCCAKGNDQHGVCKSLVKPGRGFWCPLKVGKTTTNCVQTYINLQEQRIRKRKLKVLFFINCRNKCLRTTSLS